MKNCPKCGKEYADISAVSRSEFVEICPECGIREALTVAGIKPDKQSEILAVIRELTAVDSQGCEAGEALALDGRSTIANNG